MFPRWLLLATMALTVSSGCDLAIRDGLFACGQPTDCPTGYFCWTSNNRCHDSGEPPCEPRSCDHVIGELAELGIDVECGSFPDGCDGSIECGGCPKGTTCGANGLNFVCGCEEVTCPSVVGGGAKCGEVPTRCGAPGETIDCGACPGDGQVCNDELQCECPPGDSCDDGCFGRCADTEVCADGKCCEPTYPCADNECSPTGGLPDGCGGNAVCPPCAETANCVLTSKLRYQCVDDCSCGGKGFECGQTTICGEPTLCGTCADNGYGEGYRCEHNRCVCDDLFEVNDSFDSFALICGPEMGGVNCVQEAWSVEVQASLHSEDDVDYYAIETLDSWTPITAETYDVQSDRTIALSYRCPNGLPGMASCSGWVEEINGVDFCVDDQRAVAIKRGCSGEQPSKIGAVLIAVEPTKFRGDCDAYSIRVVASYEQVESL